MTEAVTEEHQTPNRPNVEETIQKYVTGVLTREHYQKAEENFRAKAREVYGKPAAKVLEEWEVFFQKQASPEQRDELQFIEEEIKRLGESLNAREDEIFNNLSRYPIVTHVVTDDRNIPQILEEGLQPVAQRDNGLYDQYDAKFPELRLRDVVHCGWGGIDPFSIADTGGIVLLIDPSIVKPEDKVTLIDWSKWAPIRIAQHTRFNAEEHYQKEARDKTVKQYLKEIRQAGDYQLNPYPQANTYRYLMEGKNANPGYLSIPTILLDKVPPEAIKGAIIEEALNTQRPELKTKLEEHGIAVFGSADDDNRGNLSQVDIPDGVYQWREAARLSHRARFAQAFLQGEAEQFKSNLAGDAENIQKYQEELERGLVLKGIRIRILDAVQRKRAPL
jgi:hypothetical protein